MAAASLTPAQLQALLDGPAESPPPGVIPNFVDPPSIYPQIIVTLVLTLCISTLALVIRTYTKLRVIKAWHLEDYFIIVAWLGEVGEAVPAMLTVKYGAKYHMWDVQLKETFKLLRYINYSAILYGPTVTFIKVAILLQYLRIFVPNRQGNLVLYYTILITMGVVIAFYVIITAFTIAQCVPREKIWNPLMPGGFCFSAEGIFGATGVFNVISDFTLLLIPIWSVWKLQMRKSRKIAITAVFATGLFVCITSVLRTYNTWLLIESSDLSWNVAVMGLWTWAEMSVGILIACLPVTPKFVSFVGPKIQSIFSSIRKSRSSSTSGTNTLRNSGDLSEKPESANLESTDRKIRPEVPHTDTDTDSMTNLKDQSLQWTFEDNVSEAWQRQALSGDGNRDSKATKRDTFEDRSRYEV